MRFDSERTAQRSKEGSGCTDAMAKGGEDGARAKSDRDIVFCASDLTIEEE